MAENETDLSDFQNVFDPPIENLYLAVCFLVIFSGISFNLSIIWLFHRRDISHTLFNFCLVQLGISNIFQNVNAIPYIVVDLRKTDKVNWIVDSVRCGFVDGQSLFFTGAFVTVYIISFMSVKWYLIIKNPLNARQHQDPPVKYIVLLWIMACLIITPNFFTFELDPFHGFCTRAHQENVFDYVLTYKIVLLIVGFVLPIFVMIIAFALIVRQFYVKTNIGENVSQVKLKYRKKVVRFLGIVIGVFLFLLVSIRGVLDIGYDTCPRFASNRKYLF